MTPKPEQKEKLLSIGQTARRLGCHASSVRRYILSGHLRALQFQKFGKIRIAESELERFLADAEYSEPIE